MHVKLLRALQEKCVRRVGGKDIYPIKCRVISAMNEDPYMLIEEGRLRQDLFYRIAGYNLHIPPLRERENDLFELTEHYILNNNLSMNKNIVDITDDLKGFMKDYTWPGNIRELEHFIENITVRSNNNDRYLKFKNVPRNILEAMKSNIEDLDEPELNKEESLQEKLDNIEKKLIFKALNENLWSVTKTANVLGISRQSLNYRIRKFNIKRE